MQQVTSTKLPVTRKALLSALAAERCTSVSALLADLVERELRARFGDRALTPPAQGDAR